MTRVMSKSSKKSDAEESRLQEKLGGERATHWMEPHSHGPFLENHSNSELHKKYSCMVPDIDGFLFFYYNTKYMHPGLLTRGN